jgi:hypothetical protein
MSEADRRRQVERFFGLSHLPRPLFRNRNAEPSIEEIDDQGIALGRNATERIVAASRNSHQLCVGNLRYCLRTPIGLDLIVVAVDHQHGTADLAIHRLADIERRRD